MLRKSYAKVNIFLKITGKRNNYHTIASRFVRVKNLYDTCSFLEEKNKSFTLYGNFSCALETNTIYKAYELVKTYKNVEEFCKKHSFKVEKNIPEFAGLAGGSSNAASFLLMVNEACSLNLSTKQLAKIGLKIGADVPFFIYEYDSANVSGIGEIVEKFKEDSFDIEVFTPKIPCNTGEIFKLFSKKFYKTLEKNKEKELFSKTSKELLESLDIYGANDLYKSALYLNPKLKEYEKKDYFFSGSGSSFFKIKVKNG